MVKGAVLLFADGSKLEGDVFGWIEILQSLSSPNFFFEPPNPFANIMAEIAPFQLAQLVDYAMKKHWKDIRNRKDLQLEQQWLERTCMVEQAYMAGARELFLEGVRLGIVPNAIADDVRAKLKVRWIQLWRDAAGRAYGTLVRINQNVHAKGRKAHPLRTSDVNSLKGHMDDAILHNVDSRCKPRTERTTDEYATHMREGIVPEVKRFIREGKLSGGLDGDDFQYHVDKHAKRIRDRLDDYLSRFKQRAN